MTDTRAKFCTITGCPFELCTVEGMRSSKWCYWHRLERMTPDAQHRAMLLRRTGKHLPPFIGQPGQRCGDCMTDQIPNLYMDGPRCKACAREKRRTARDARTYTYPEGYDRKALEALQDGRCAICGNRQARQALATDHDHATGLVRGLLCDRCNHDLLGSAFDSRTRLVSALYYLDHPPTSGHWVPFEQRGLRLVWVDE